MSTEIAQWQPRTLPDGWRVMRVEVEHTLDPWRPEPPLLIVELRHMFGWSFRFETHDPTRMDEAGLVALLNALTSTTTGLERMEASWDGRGW